MKMHIIEVDATHLVASRTKTDHPSRCSRPKDRYKHRCKKEVPDVVGGKLRFPTLGRTDQRATHNARIVYKNIETFVLLDKILGKSGDAPVVEQVERGHG